MYKHAGQFAARNPDLVPYAHQYGRRVPPWAVVAFWWRRAANGAIRPYRRVWPFVKEGVARAKYNVLCARAGDPYALVGLVHDDGLHESAGDLTLARDWVTFQRGVNRGADPWTSASYSGREHPAARDKAWTDEHGEDL